MPSGLPGHNLFLLKKVEIASYCDYILTMPQRSSKKRPQDDPNVTAFNVVKRATATKDAPEAPPEKNPAAVALGRLGGKKGGPARAAKLSAKRRSEIAQTAARARWDKEIEGES